MDCSSISFVQIPLATYEQRRPSSVLPLSAEPVFILGAEPVLILGAEPVKLIDHAFLPAAM